MEKLGPERYRPHKGGVGDRPKTLIKIGNGKQWDDDEVEPRARPSGVWAQP